MQEKKIETVTLELLAINTESKRSVFVFNDPLSGKELRFSAFPPIPKMEIGKTYEFMVEHVPTGDGKFYHNLHKKNKDGVYEVKEINQNKTLDQKPSSSANSIGNNPDAAKEQYWKNKEARDIAKEIIINRLACMKIASNLISNVVQPGMDIKSVVEVLKKVTLDLEIFSNEAKQIK